MSHDEPPAVLQQLNLLLTGYGYNFYNEKNKMRADDLLVRQRASSLLGSAAAALTTLEAEYQRRHVPPSTREQPFPPRETLDNLRDLGDLRGKLENLASAIRSMPVPAQDRTWWRLRSESSLLGQLLRFDLVLIDQAGQIERSMLALSADTWHLEHPHARCVAELRPLEEAIRERRALLQIQI